MAVRIACLSDLHGRLPDVDALDGADVLVLAGDVEPDDAEPRWLTDVLAPWLEQARRKRFGAIVATAGNHDVQLHADPRRAAQLPWTYLADAITRLHGLTIFGTPWSLGDPSWPYTLATEQDLDVKLAQIPEETDVVISHGPLHGLLDTSALDRTHRGSKALLTRVIRVRPRLVVVGHTHPGRGRFDGELHGTDGFGSGVRTTVVNASADADLTPIHVELP